ncbi:MAG: hypothetical protein Q7R52_01695 [archaeon]|nr:hypothetical protein [archaeon]
MKMKNIETCANKNLIGENPILKAKQEQKTERCYNCDGHDDNCSGYTIITEECYGL